MIRRHPRPLRSLVALVLAAAALACGQAPVVGAHVTAPATGDGPKIAVEDAWIDLHGHAVATFTVTENAVPVGLAEVTALAPRFTLAKLTDHPADGQRAWESLLPIGARVAAQLPPGGPGDPDVLTSVRQPGAEIPASIIDLGDGRFRYVYARAVTGFSPDETIRVGVWLDAIESPSLQSSTTYDFRPSGGPVEARDAVLDKNCETCHGHAVVAHDRRVGVRLCLTCHTWQATDPLTVDPAALVTTGVSARTNPNPLELGRLVHRIHRGRDLPTIYQTAWDGVSPTTVPSPTGLPGPFVQQKPGSLVRWALPGRKYSVTREDGHEVVYAQAVSLIPFDPSLANTQYQPVGGLFPRDLRDCAVCHADAPQGYLVKYGISRRTCSGCHPEVWFQAVSPAADRVRYPHPGGPQSDDTGCRGCHVDGSTNKLYAPLDEVHVPPARSPRYNQPYLKIVRVDDVQPGKRPKVTFRLWDRVGAIAPSPKAPVPLFEPDGPSSSLVSRAFAANGIVIKIQGPTMPDFAMTTGVLLNSGSAGGNPDPMNLTTSSGTDEYVYTFTSTMPPATAGTFIVGIEARRGGAVAFYDKVADAFRFPFTGETVNESIDNTWVFVNSASGAWPPPAGTPDPVARRKVVAIEKCNRCHDRIEFHSGARHDPNWCLTCHTYDLTDLDKRVGTTNPPTTAGRLYYPDGPVNIGATFDGIEERSTHFKVNMHRMHTGKRKGASTLEAILPYVLYFSKAYFFDGGGFPGDLRNCTWCHEGKSYLIESVPSFAPPSLGNEDSTIWHPSPIGSGPNAHDPDEPRMLPLRAACTGCHASAATFTHVASKTVNGVETCAQCHSKGNLSVEVAHGLAPATGGGATASFSSIVQNILVPRCATTACHAAGGTAPNLEASSAYGALVGVQSGQSSLRYVEPNQVEQSYLVFKLRGTAGTVGGSTATLMPPDGALAPADEAAIEAWIANGAPND